MEDKKTLAQRADEAWEALQAREKELEPAVEKKKEELDNQIAAAQNELEILKNERTQNSHGTLWGIFNKSKKAQNEKLLKELDVKIEKVQKELEKLEETKEEWEYGNNPLGDAELERLINIWSPLYEEKKKKEDEEILGINNLYVFADTKWARTYGSTGHVSVSMKIDGNERGFVAEPFSVIPLSEGIHSISFVLSYSGGEIYTKELQFSLRKNNKFIVVDKINCSTALSNSGVDINQYDRFETFVDKAGYPYYKVNEFKNYLKNL